MVVPQAELSYRQDCVLTAEAASEERLLQLWQWFCSRAQLQAGLRTDSRSSVRGVPFTALAVWFCSRAQLQAGLRADGGSGVCGALLTALAVVLLARLSYRQDCVLTAEAASVERLLQLGRWFCSWAQLQAGLRADGVSSV
ncbi:hypothetical protein NDU88_000219 [Pleurodeles waltl]|uniref:Uncharacterized protein n=1 Tax=Pleurodeles waltl TaxID=8319 RepID=A0AAV7P930_PLEWA|nr:hypothetical protein NDU88_000219 [Pleurodeles waltl]